MKKYIILVISALMVSLSTMGQESKNLQVKTQAGVVEGIEQEGSLAFLGIPYAEVERFMPPLPVKPWQGVRKCDHWGPQVMQFTNGRKLSEAEMSEKNSCVLNVWTTDCAANKPVMLWIHGGGFDSGASTWNPGMCLAKKDVVVVSLNHRLNILGFLDLSACSEKYKYSANVGMLDIVAALQWIRDNISQFGGDPNNVTIFGESGGGGKVGTLLSMPSAKGLFHKAIIMSGTILNVNTKAMSESLGKAVLKELDIDAAHIDRIKDVPYDKLYAAGQKAMAASIGTRKPGTPMMWGFGPTPDGETLLQQPFQPGFSDISSDVPIMIGTTFNELQRLQYANPLTLQDAREALKPTFGSDTESYIEAMKAAWPDCSPQDMLSIDWLFRPKTLITADAIATSRNAPTYMYMFNWRSPLSKGSVHGAELMFCFNTLHHSKRDLPQPTDKDLKLADLMSSVWAQFAHKGNPNVQGLPRWQPYSAKNGEMMVFDYLCQIRNNPDRQLQEIINKHCFKQLDEFQQRNGATEPCVQLTTPMIDLPDPLLMNDGKTRVTELKDWSARRQEIANLIQEFGIGKKPEVPREAVKARMDGDTLIVDVTVNGETLTLKSCIHYPSTGKAPYALMIGTSMLSLPKPLFENRPIAIMNYHENQVNDYSQWRPHHERGEYHFDRLYPHLKDNGAYSQWAWGLSRLIDGLEILGPEKTKIDVKRIGVSGCSYAGKMALFCGAFDERVALTISQEPGGGGAASWRYSHRQDSVENLDKTDYHWFLESMRERFHGDSVYLMPYDHHELVAMVCPRALLVLGNPDFKWLADESAYVSLNAARKVWQQFGIEDRMGYSIVGGHPHCQLPEIQFPEVEAFIDKFLLGKTGIDTKNVLIHPFSSVLKP